MMVAAVVTDMTALSVVSNNVFKRIKNQELKLRGKMEVKQMTVLLKAAGKLKGTLSSIDDTATGCDHCKYMKILSS